MHGAWPLNAPCSGGVRVCLVAPRLAREAADHIDYSSQDEDPPRFTLPVVNPSPLHQPADAPDVWTVIVPLRPVPLDEGSCKMYFAFVYVCLVSPPLLPIGLRAPLQRVQAGGKLAIYAAVVAALLAAVKLYVRIDPFS